MTWDGNTLVGRKLKEFFFPSEKHLTFNSISFWMYTSGIKKTKIPFLSLNINSHCQVKKAVIVMTVQWNKIRINSENGILNSVYWWNYIVVTAFKYIKSYFNYHKPGSFYLSKDVMLTDIPLLVISSVYTTPAMHHSQLVGSEGCFGKLTYYLLLKFSSCFISPNFQILYGYWHLIQ